MSEEAKTEAVDSRTLVKPHKIFTDPVKCNVDLTGVMDKLPDGIPTEHKRILSLSAMGLSSKTVAEQMRVSEGVVKWVLKEYGLKDMPMLVMAERKIFLGMMLEQVAAEALSSMNAEDIRRLGIKAKMDVIMKCANSLRALDFEPGGVSKEKAEATLRMLVDKVLHKEVVGNDAKPPSPTPPESPPSSHQGNPENFVSTIESELSTKQDESRPV